jgi:small-conductance mechanosensitive channel
MELINTWVPHWIVGLAIMVAPAILALLLYRWIVRSVIRLIGSRSPFLVTLLDRSQQPIGVILVIFALGLALPAAQFPTGWTLAIGHALLFALILALGWTAAKGLNIAAELYLRRFRLDVEDNLLARKHITQINILLRTGQTLLVILTLGSALMTLQQVRQYGVSLFASAGAAGLVLGLAARPVLSNLLAGIQIAMTQPIRVEDAVIVENEWGWIERITSTYVVIRIWDLRRLIVPLSYFIEKPFQNWTYESANLLGAVMLHVDYQAPIARIREELDRIVHDTPLWDGKVVVLQVTEAPSTMVELRALVSARTAGQAFDLRCFVRERLIAFLQAEHPEALPRQRAEIAGSLDAQPPLRRTAEPHTSMETATAAEG